jgi:hypothetical protein
VSGGIEVGCDGLLALNKAFDTWPFRPTLRQLIEESPSLLGTTWHITGHLDNDSMAKLDYWAQQNIKMDNLENVFWMQHSHSFSAIPNLA